MGVEMVPLINKLEVVVDKLEQLVVGNLPLPLVLDQQRRMTR